MGSKGRRKQKWLLNCCSLRCGCTHVFHSVVHAAQCDSAREFCARVPVSQSGPCALRILVAHPETTQGLCLPNPPSVPLHQTMFATVLLCRRDTGWVTEYTYATTSKRTTTFTVQILTFTFSSSCTCLFH